MLRVRLLEIINAFFICTVSRFLISSGLIHTTCFTSRILLTPLYNISVLIGFAERRSVNVRSEESS